MVGLPYPNKNDPILQEKMKYIDDQSRSVTSSAMSTKGISTSTGMGTALASMQYYENLCMRAVNQSIGRSIRHAKDYAAIILVDQR